MDITDGSQCILSSVTCHTWICVGVIWNDDLIITERWTVYRLFHWRERSEISHGIICADADAMNIKKRIIRGWFLQILILPTCIWTCTLLQINLNKRIFNFKWHILLTLENSRWVARVLSALFLDDCRQDMKTATNRTMLTAETTTKIISILSLAMFTALSCMVMNITTKIIVAITPSSNTSRDDIA